MARRRSIYTILARKCDGGRPPNKYIPEISVEIRAFFPPNVSFLEVADALKSGYDHAMDELRDAYPEHS